MSSVPVSTLSKAACFIGSFVLLNAVASSIYSFIWASAILSVVPTPNILLLNHPIPLDNIPWEETLSSNDVSSPFAWDNNISPKSFIVNTSPFAKVIPLFNAVVISSDSFDAFKLTSVPYNAWYKALRFASVGFLLAISYNSSRSAS